MIFAVYITYVHYALVTLLPTSRLRLHSTSRRGLTATQCGKKERQTKREKN